MDWFAHKTKPNEFRYDLLIKFGTDGYYTYFRAVEILAEEDKFFEMKRASKEQFELQFFPLKWERLAEIFTWISEQEKAEFRFVEAGDKFFIHTVKLADMNKEYARKHNIKPAETVFPAVVQPSAVQQPSVGRKISVLQDNTIQYKTKEKKKIDITPDGVSMLDVVKLFCKMRKELKPVFDDYEPKWPKEVKLASSIKNLSSTTIKEKMIIYFKTADNFYKKKGYDFPTFISNINAFSVKKINKSEFTPETE